MELWKERGAWTMEDMGMAEWQDSEEGNEDESEEGGKEESNMLDRIIAEEEEEEEEEWDEGASLSFTEPSLLTPTATQLVLEVRIN